MNKSNTIIVIPARGNSKGIKKKNLIKFCGKPLLYWTIVQAKKSKFRKNIYVSSEDEKILKFSKGLGVNTIKRPMSLSQDDSSSESAIQNVVDNLNFNVKILFFYKLQVHLENQKILIMLSKKWLILNQTHFFHVIKLKIILIYGKRKIIDTRH